MQEEILTVALVATFQLRTVAARRLKDVKLVMALSNAQPICRRL